MRSNVSSNLSAADASVNQAGSAIPIQQVYAVSAQIVTTGTSTGSLQLQVSNDLASACTTDSNGNLVPANWANLGSAVTISAAGVLAVAKTDVCHQFLRAVYTKNNGASGLITVNLNTQGF